MKRTSCTLGFITGSLAMLFSFCTPTFSSADCLSDFNRAKAVSEKDAQVMSINEATTAALAWDKVTQSCPADIAVVATGMVGLYRCLAGTLYAESVYQGKGSDQAQLVRAADAWETVAAMCTGDIAREAAETAAIFKCAAEWNRAVDLEGAKESEEAARAWTKAAAACTGEDSKEASCNADYDHALALWEKMDDGMTKEEYRKVSDAWDKAAASCTGEKSDGAGLAKALLQTSL